MIFAVILTHGLGTCSFVLRDCSTCGTNIELSHSTNNYPKDFLFQILNVDTNKQTLKNKITLDADDTYVENIWLQHGNYKFFVSCLRNNT